MAAFIRFIIRYRFAVATLLLLSLGSAVYAARSIQLRFQFSDFYTYPGNPALALYERDIREFGDPAGFVVAMVQAPDVFDRAVLEYVAQLTAALTPEPVFSRIRSLTNASTARARGDDVLTGPLLAEPPWTDAALDEVEQVALNSPLIRRRLVSADKTITAVLAETRVPATLANIEQQADAIAAMTRVLAAHPAPAGVTVRITGAPRVEVDSTEAMLRDQLYLVPAVIALLVSMLFLTFNNLQAVVLALSAVGTAVVWTAGLYACTGRPADLLASVIPIALLVYGVVDPIFVLTRVLQKADAGRSKHEAIIQAFVELALPCFLTSLSTALGFAAFLTADVPALRYFGLTVAVGVLLAWVTTLTVLPVLLAFAPLPKRRMASNALSRIVDRALTRMWSTLRGRATLWLALMLLALVGGGLYASRQTLSNAYVGSLPRGRIQDDVRLLERQLTGVVRLNVYLEGKPGALKNPEALQAIDRLDRAIEAEQPLVTLSASLADVVAEIHGAFDAGTEQRIPSSRALVAQYLALIDPADRSQLVTDDYARSHIAILLEDRGSQSVREIVAAVQRQVDAAGFSALGIEASLTGNAVVGYGELDKVVSDVLDSFIHAFAIIVALQWLLFRSLRLALISVVPNLLPVVACFATTRLLGIDLKMDTSLVLCVSIGGLFNTTIHYSARVLQRIRDGERDPDQILLHVMRTVGPSALYTTIALSAGFAVFMFSSFAGFRAMGLLSMVTLVSGFVSDMLGTTVLMRVAFGWKRAFGPQPSAAAIPSAASSG